MSRVKKNRTEEELKKMVRIRVAKFWAKKKNVTLQNSVTLTESKNLEDVTQNKNSVTEKSVTFLKNEKV